MFRKLLRCAGVVLAFMLLGPVGSSQSTNGDRDVAFWREPGVQVEVSSFLFRSKKAEEQIPCPVGDRGADAADALGPCHWQSNQFQHLPQWVWVHFAGPRRMDKVVVHAASMDEPSRLRFRESIWARTPRSIGFSMWSKRSSIRRR